MAQLKSGSTVGGKVILAIESITGLAVGDLIARTAAGWERFAKGSANTHLVMNAAGTTPEYAVPYKIGMFTRAMDAAGADVAYTGVGFKPSVVIFLASLAGKSTGVGFDSSVARYMAFAHLNGATPSHDYSSSVAIMALEDGSKLQGGAIKTMDADGFTITWTKGSTPTGGVNATIIYLALR
jgi:hypothetical protein